MHKPIAVLDAGIGSYAIVTEIQRRFPEQDIIYSLVVRDFPMEAGARTAPCYHAQDDHLSGELHPIGLAIVGRQTP